MGFFYSKRKNTMNFQCMCRKIVGVFFNFEKSNYKDFQDYAFPITIIDCFGKHNFLQTNLRCFHGIYDRNRSTGKIFENSLQFSLVTLKTFDVTVRRLTCCGHRQNSYFNPLSCRFLSPLDLSVEKKNIQGYTYIRWISYICQHDILWMFITIYQFSSIGSDSHHMVSNLHRKFRP